MRCAAFNTGTDYHLLDHIAPLAALFNCPLFTTEEINYKLAIRYYPQIQVYYLPDLEFRLGEIAKNYDVLFECKYWQPHLKALFRTLYNKEMRLVFCPHGQSDKGYLAPVLAPYAFQDAVLIYGPLMMNMLKELNIAIPNHGLIGNYRLEFYQKYKSFYDLLVPSVDRSKKTVLYAPTWRDLDNSSSFFQYGTKVIAELPADWNLIIKLHPLLKQRNPAEYEAISERINQSNILLIDEFPPVYPILELADIYLGDASSVGYDFLHFQKPLYFFPGAPTGKLRSCGSILDPTQNIYRQFEKTNPFSERQKQLYQQAFEKHPKIETLLEKLTRQPAE